MLPASLVFIIIIYFILFLCALHSLGSAASAPLLQIRCVSYAKFMREASHDHTNARYTGEEACESTHTYMYEHINPLVLPTVAPLKASPRHLHAVAGKRLSTIEVICKTIHMQHMIILCVQTRKIIEIK